MKVKWEGYDGKGGEEQAPKVPVLTERTLMGYGKPLNQNEAVKFEKQTAKFRQAPGNSAVIHFSFLFIDCIISSF